MNRSIGVRHILSAAEFFFGAVFLISCWQSDRALDKAGIGDPKGAAGQACKHAK